MIRSIEYQTGEVLTDPTIEELALRTRETTELTIAGFIVRGMTDGLTAVIEQAKLLGLDGDVKVSMPFKYDADQAARFKALGQHGQPQAEQWNDYGVTPLHADSHEGDRILSASQVKRGRYELRIFRRGPELNDVPAIDLWEVLDSHTYRAAHDSTVDDDWLLPRATILGATPDDVVVFNPSSLHMAVTLEGPRHSESVFLQ